MHILCKVYFGSTVYSLVYGTDRTLIALRTTLTLV